MITLPHGCWMSKPSVNPKNWKQVGASIKKPWYIQYYFNDPAFRGDPRYKYGKLRIIKGMNKYTSPAERREATQKLIDDEIRLLSIEGYNTITGKYNPEVIIQYEIDPYTPLIKALNAAFDRMEFTRHTKEDIRSVLKYFSRAAARTRFEIVPIKDVRRKHIKLILEQCGQVKKNWSDNQYNTYRKYLMMLFSELVELDVCELNPIKEIKKKKTIHRIRPVLNAEERKKVDSILKKGHYSFWRFMHIFFHSGSRETEMLRVKGQDVDLAGQRFKVTIKKGKTINEKWKTIKDIVLPLWQEAMINCNKDQFVFSKGLVPGHTSIRPDQISRRWKLHIKDKHGIVADFYALKHLNLDETAEALSIEYAAKMASHTTPVITIEHYTYGEKERQHQLLKKVNNSFA